MEKLCTFLYRGQLYQTTIIASTNLYPHFYWCLLFDAKLISELGDDSIGFKMNQDGVLYPSGFYPGYYQDLVDLLQALVIEQFLHTKEPL